MKSLLEAIGNTPLVHLGRYAPENKIYAKLESANPLGSAKDRAAFGMIMLAEEKGEIKKGDYIIEATSGNTGIGLAWISRLKGYKTVLAMPSNMSEERQKILKYLGAEIILTEAEKGMLGSIEACEKIAKERKGYLIKQFENPGNPLIHYQTTGPEIYQQMEGKVDYAIFGVGTGGTLSGSAKFLKEQNKNIKIIAIEPAESPMLSQNKAGVHGIQGIGANFIPKNLDMSLLDEIYSITTQEAIKNAQKIAEKEGIFVGISSGAAACAAFKLAQKKPTARIVTVFPDTAERYLSTELFTI